MEQNRLASHLIIRWRTHTLGFCCKPNLISIPWLGHPNPYHKITHHRSKLCLIALVGSVGFFTTLLKYSLFSYIVDFYPTFLHCWIIANPNTLLRYSLSYCFAKQFPISIQCSVTLNHNTKLKYSLSYYIAEQFPLSIHCWPKPNLKTLFRYNQH